MNTIKPTSINKDHLLIDVRSPSEYEAAHIEGSYNIPLDQISAFKDELRNIKDGVIICRTDRRAQQAARELHGVGADVAVLKGGIQAWQDANRELIFGNTTWSIQRQVRFTAGSLTAIGTALGAFLNAWFLILPGFIGLGLTYAGITNTCGMSILLARAPWNTATSHVKEHVKKIREHNSS